METTSSREQEAERLRKLGNDAFGTKDWDRALELYQRSAELDPGTTKEAAKTYSNLAAVLCKLSRFGKAYEAAKRATVIDPLWAKGWWRRGVVVELQKLFVRAHTYYSTAVELDPKERTFRKALAGVEKRLNMSKTKSGLQVMDYGLGPGVSSIKNDAQEKGELNILAAWDRYKHATNGTCNMQLYLSQQQGDPTSEEWLVCGLDEWVTGLTTGMAMLSISINPQLRHQAQLLQFQGLSGQQMMEEYTRLLGGVPDGSSLQRLMSAFAHLGGHYIMLETGGAPRNGGTDFLVPQPPHLSSFPAYQALVLLMSINDVFMEMLHVFGRNAKMSEAVIVASQTFYSNLGVPAERLPEAGGIKASPQEVVTYLAQQLGSGNKTWDGGVRKYVSLQYRGTILYAALMRIFGQLAEGYKHEQWAGNFITLADEEFQVSQDNAYEERGSAFRPSYQVGMLLSELLSLHALRGDQVHGPYPISDEMDLCVKIINMAHKATEWQHGMDRHSMILDVAFRRKPLSLAHSTLGAALTTLSQVAATRDEFNLFVQQHGYTRNNEHHDDDRNPYAVIAEHYRLAAESELSDADNAAIYWWGYAANMTRSGAVRGDGDLSKEGYTLGELRMAIKKAEEAEQARDVGLFGVNRQRGGSLEIQAKLISNHYQGETDEFILPEMIMVGEGSKLSLCVGDQVLCSNFEETVMREVQLRASFLQNEMIDTSEMDEKYGPDLDVSVPPLETLCIRQLHKQECEFAVGETDAATIHYKAMMAWQKEAEKMATSEVASGSCGTGKGD